MLSKKRPVKSAPEQPSEPEQSESASAQSVYSFVLPDGGIPFNEWLYNLRDRAAQARIILRVRRIVTTGNFGDHKSVGEGVWELRIDYGPGYRIYFGRVNHQVILLLLGGDKSDQESDIIMTMVPWDDPLSETFRDPEFIKEYLRAAWQEEGTNGVLMALKHIAEMSRRRPSENAAGGPTLAVIYEALDTLGLELSVRAAH